MRIALMIEGQEGVTWEQWVAIARACEEHGIPDLFRSDHYVGLMGDETRDATDAWATIAALGAVTSTLRLGTLVSPVTFRHPSVLAKMVATADNVSGGRVQVGIGAGWNEREHVAYGFDFPDVATRFELLGEQVEIVRRLLTEETVSFSGSHYQLEDVRPLPRPVQSPVPLIMGGNAGPRAAALAARFADEYNTIGAGMSELPERLAQLDAACEDAGRDPATLTRSMMTVGILGRTHEEVVERAGALMAKAGADGDPAAFVEERADRWIAGTVEQVRDQLGRLEEMGIERVMLQHLVHDDLETIAMIGQELAGG